MNKVSTFSPLCTVSRYKNKRLRHQLTKHFSHFRISSANYSTYITIFFTHVVFSPLSNLFANPFVQRTSVDQAILELSTGRIRSFNKNKQTFFFFFTYFDKRSDTVRSHVWIQCCKVLIKSCIFLRTNLYMSEMSDCIRCGCRTDITTFDITNHNKIFGFAVIYSLFVCLQSRNSKLFIHGNLRLHSGNKIICCINDSFIELPDCFCCSFQSLTKLHKCLFLNMFRNIVQHRIKSYNDRCIGFTDFFNKLVNHNCFLLMIYIL